ncbi:hypothetical protein AAB109_11355 [Priestia megaterium]|uniref:hypothetical protein n=1 Tax=Priestia megaterium TaxID=1404 RepID=UPI002ACDA351|nr:hypothetical protein [Priestia megaterium]
MIIRNIQFFLFGDFEEIEAQPESILDISTKFLENGISVIPGTFQQVNPNQGMKSYERIMFNNSKEQFNIQIGMEAIQINKLIVDNKAYNFKSETDQFLSKIKKVIKALNDSDIGFNNGRRISLIIDVLHDPKKIKSFSEVYSTLSNKLPNYEPEEAFEWNTRAVKRRKIDVAQQQEELNIVTEVLRTAGEINNSGKTERFDTIQTKIDINTIDDNKKPRINEEFVRDFLDNANDIFCLHFDDIEVMIVESK